MKTEPKTSDCAERIRRDSDYLTLGCFIAAILIVLITIGFRVSYDISAFETRHSSQGASAAPSPVGD